MQSLLPKTLWPWKQDSEPDLFLSKGWIWLAASVAGVTLEDKCMDLWSSVMQGSQTIPNPTWDMWKKELNKQQGHRGLTNMCTSQIYWASEGGMNLQMRTENVISWSTDCLITEGVKWCNEKKLQWQGNGYGMSSAYGPAFSPRNKVQCK